MRFPGGALPEYGSLHFATQLRGNEAKIHGVLISQLEIGWGAGGGRGDLASLGWAPNGPTAAARTFSRSARPIPADSWISHHFPSISIDFNGFLARFHSILSLLDFGWFGDHLEILAHLQYEQHV